MTPETREVRREYPPCLTLAIVANVIWMNASEVFRYFVFVMPMMREAFPQVVGIAPMNVPVFMIWGLWDMILVLAATGFSWMYLDRFGPSISNAVAAGTALWFAVFVILWLGLFNMNLAPAGVLLIALPLAWIEMIIAALIVQGCMARYTPSQ